MTLGALGCWRRPLEVQSKARTNARVSFPLGQETADSEGWMSRTRRGTAADGQYSRRAAPPRLDHWIFRRWIVSPQPPLEETADSEGWMSRTRRSTAADATTWILRGLSRRRRERGRSKDVMLSFRHGYSAETGRGYATRLIGPRVPASSPPPRIIHVAPRGGAATAPYSVEAPVRRGPRLEGFALQTTIVEDEKYRRLRSFKGLK